MTPFLSWPSLASMGAAFAQRLDQCDGLATAVGSEQEECARIRSGNGASTPESPRSVLLLDGFAVYKVAVLTDMVAPLAHMVAALANMIAALALTDASVALVDASLSNTLAKIGADT